MKFSSCCGSGVRAEEKNEVLQYTCRLCDNRCVATITSEPGCPICDGPISTNFKDGKQEDYCWQHGCIEQAKNHASVVLSEFENIIEMLTVGRSIAMGDCKHDPAAEDDYVTDCEALLARITQP